MKTWNDRLRYAIDASKSSKKAVARAAGVQPSSLQGWISREAGTQKVDAYAVDRMCGFLGIRRQWLLYGTGEMRPSGGEDEDVQVFTREDFAYRTPLLAFSDISDWLQSRTWDKEWIPVLNAPSDRCFSVKMPDDSMQSSSGTNLPQGFFLTINPDVTPADNMLALVESGGVYLVRRLIQGMTALKAANPQYPVVPFDGQIIGAVIGCYVNDLKSKLT